MGFETKQFLKLYKWQQNGAIYSEQYILQADEESPEIKIPLGFIYAVGLSYSALAGPDIEITFDTWDRIDNDEAVWFEWDGNGQCNCAVTGVRFVNGPSENTVTLTIKMGF